MELEKLIRDGEKWGQQISIEEVMEASENPGLCLIRKANLNEENLGEHIRAVEKFDFEKGMLTYIGPFGNKQNQSLDTQFFDEHIIFNPKNKDYKGQTKISGIKIAKHQIEYRGKQLYRLYFSHLLKDHETDTIGSGVVTRFNPRLLKYLSLGAAGLMLVTAWLAFKFEFHPGQYEKGLFPPIHRQYEGIKEKNIGRLVEDLRKAHIELGDSKKAFEEFKKDPGFNTDDALYILPPNDSEYRHSSQDKIYFTDFARITSTLISYDYRCADLMSTVCGYAVENPEAMKMVQGSAPTRDGRSAMFDFIYLEVPTNIVGNSHIGYLSREERDKPFKIIFQPDFGVHKTVEKGLERKAGLYQSQNIFEGVRQDTRMFRRFEPNHNVIIPEDVKSLLR